MWFYKDHFKCGRKEGRKTNRPLSGLSSHLHKRWLWLRPRLVAKEMEKKKIIIITPLTKQPLITVCLYIEVYL